MVSDILNYKKGLPKNTIRILSEKFKLSQETFNRPYELHVPVALNLKIPGWRTPGRNRHWPTNNS
ncbi:MAG: hypothetical protein AAB212_01410 [Bacteroidota bacterium]